MRSAPCRPRSRLRIAPQRGAAASGRLCAALLAAALLILTASTSSRATLYGPSGLILNPTADVALPRSFAAGASTFDAQRPDRHLRWASATAAIGPGYGAEVGATYLRLSGLRDGSGGGGFLKYQIVPAGPLTPAVAVGGGYIGGEQVKTSDADLVVTEGAGPVAGMGPMRVSVGGIYSWFRDGLRRRDWDVLAGASLPLRWGLGLAAEWRSKTKGNAEDASGAMLTLTGRYYGIGVGVLQNGWGDSFRFFIGVGFNVSTLD